MLTRKGTIWLNKYSEKVSRQSLDSSSDTNRYSDWIILAGLDEVQRNDVEDVISDADRFQSLNLTRDNLRQSIRRLFEAGYIQEV